MPILREIFAHFAHIFIVSGNPTYLLPCRKRTLSC